jgi:hypothetical protein
MQQDEIFYCRPGVLAENGFPADGPQPEMSQDAVESMEKDALMLRLRQTAMCRLLAGSLVLRGKRMVEYDSHIEGKIVGWLDELACVRALKTLLPRGVAYSRGMPLSALVRDNDLVLNATRSAHAAVSYSQTPARWWTDLVQGAHGVLPFGAPADSSMLAVDASARDTVLRNILQPWRSALVTALFDRPDIGDEVDDERVRITTRVSFSMVSVPFVSSRFFV